MPGIADLFRELLPFKWADTSFPVTEMAIDLAHDLAEHKYWGKDGARIEATGRQPLIFTAKIPFNNGIFPGKGEQWSHAVLYPDGYRAFLAAFADRTTRELQHPELGVVLCKPDKMRTMWSGASQGGVVVEATWRETRDEQSADVFARTSPVSGVLAAGDLDSVMTNEQLRALIPDLPEFEPSFADTVRSIIAVTDKVSMLQKRAAGRIDQVANQVDRISQSLERARTALSWPADQACMRLGDSLQRLHEELSSTGRALHVKVISTPTTLANLHVQLTRNAVQAGSMGIDALIKLNPHLAREQTVRKGRVVKYWGAKAA